MDIDFIIQDTYALTRPQWRLAKDFEEAGRAFAESVTLNYKTAEAEKIIEPDAPEDESSSEDDADDEELHVPEIEDVHSSSEEVEAEVRVHYITRKRVLILPAFDKWRRKARFRFRRRNHCNPPRRRARPRCRSGL